MILKKLELYGFKSFADRQELKFDSGITGIVGPNGCGKSNIADAIRWVEGEQSSKLLRGSNMQDVIFSGTQARRPLGFCEVNIFFDNSQRTLPEIDHSEVVITRKLYRDGKSEYLINKQNARLKDIVNILRDIGIGKEGYSIIGQGQVDKIISSKPEDRRAIFEEAAGISKYKQTKIESERKLERTTENLVRITDIKVELERQYAPMQKQVESAKKYLILKEQLKSNEVNLYLHQFEQASNIKKGIDANLDVIIEETALRQSQLEAAAREYSKMLEDLNNADYDQKKYTQEILSLTVLLEKTKGEAKLVAERLNFLIEQKSKLENDVKNLQAMNLAAIDELASKTKLITKKQAEVQVLEKQEQKINEHYVKIVDTLTEGEDELENSQRANLENINNLGDIKAQEARLDTELNVLKEREIDLRNQIASVVIDEQNKEAKKQQEELNLANKTVAQLEATKQKISLAFEQATSKSKQATQNSTQSNSKLVHLQSKHKMLKDLAAENEGYAYSVKKILEASAKDAKFAKYVLGTVAQSFKVSQKLETAIEMALGNAIQNVITSNEEHAKEIINFLKLNRFGRATMLPLNTVKPRSIESQYMPLIKTHAIDIASNLIDYDKKYDGVFKMLLGGVVVCQDLDSANALARATGSAFKIVTVEGEVLETRGSITGGSKKNEGTSIIARAREIEEIEKNIITTLAVVEKEQEQVKVLEGQLLQLTKEQEKTIEQLTAEKIKTTKLESVLASYNEATKNKMAQVEQDKKELETNIKYQQKIVADKTALAKAKQQLEGKRQNFDTTWEKQQKQFGDLKKQKDIYNQDITQVKVQKASLESQLFMLEQDCADLQGQLEMISKNLATSEETLKKTEREIMLCGQMSFDLKSGDEDAKNIKRLDDLKQRLENIDNVKKERQAQLVRIEETRTALMGQLNALNDQKTEKEVAKSRVDSDIEFMQQRVFEEYGLAYQEARQFRIDDFDIDAGKTEANKLKREIFKLGAINVNAIEDIRDVEERLELFATQEQDLTKAKEDLLKIINDLTNEMSEKFSKKFALIASSFSKVFSELFGGGSAQLLLQENDLGPLNEGIEIVAQPPGKKLQNITLLSGGEKALCAIAILFGILNAQPMPFCVLDEIDAALDEPNTVRFANFLKKFSKDSQFIIITHRKPTMEVAHALYGVTMEEKGISKLVSATMANR